MKSKDERIAELEEHKAKTIAKLEAEIAKLKDETYILIQVVPDCGGGIQDRTTDIAVSKNIKVLIDYCESNFAYSPSLTDKKPESDKELCKSWYKVVSTDVEILN